MTPSQRTAPARVVVVSHTGDVGGAEIALLRLLRVRDRAAFDVSAIVLEDGEFAALLRADGVDTEVVDAPGLARVTRGEAASSVGALWRNGVATLAIANTVRRMLRGAGADLVVANSLKSAIIVGLGWFRRPWVWHVHDRLAADYLPAPLAAGLRTLARVGPRRIVANSRATARTLGSFPADRVTVAYPGLPPETFTDSLPDERPPVPTVGIVGRISATKGQRVFLEAARRVLGRVPAARFRIIGSALFEDAPEERDLRAFVAKTPELAASVEWKGWVGDTRAELRRLTLAVHASPVPEPFGQVIVEAMAEGVPVIGTDAGGVPEIMDPSSSATEIADGIHRGDLGLLVRAGDGRALARAIEWMLDHQTEADAMASAARTSARDRFSITRTWAAVADAWRAALTAPR